ncbi:O-antigen polymerase [Mucilaginibacter sp. NFX135]|uniref:O-antigen polymerase n=1 Tax=Mucilaginibacter sp. NFX135 TaxID=3402687 RepID=UPI003AFA7B0E
MREFSFILLLISTIIPVIQAYKDRDKIYQLPFLYSMAVMVWILPTLLGVIDNKKLVTDSEYIRYCLFSVLCYWAAIVGYITYGNKRKPKVEVINAYDPDKMSRFLYVIMVISFGALIVMGGYDAESRNGGTYAVLLYPARCLRPATIMLLTLYLVKPSKDKMFFLIISVLFSLKIIIIDGRRSEVFNLMITIVFPLFFIKNIRVKRSLILPAVFVGVFVITVLPAYRNYSLKGNFSSLADISPTAVMASYVVGDNRNEVVDAARNVEVADLSGDYNWGITLYNAFIYQYASSNIFGAKFKEELMIPYNLDLVKLRDQHAKYDGDEYRYYLSPTGFAAVFFEFGYLGFILFFLFAIITKRYYLKAIRRDNISAIMFYCFFSTFILFSIYDSMLFIPTNIIMYLLVFVGARKFSRIHKKFYIMEKV